MCFLQEKRIFLCSIRKIEAPIFFTYFKVFFRIFRRFFIVISFSSKKYKKCNIFYSKRKLIFYFFWKLVLWDFSHYRILFWGKKSKHPRRRMWVLKIDLASLISGSRKIWSHIWVQERNKRHNFMLKHLWRGL